MSPRLPSSTTWTALPKEFAQKVQRVFVDHFTAEAEAGAFLVEGQIYPGEIMIRIGYNQAGQLRQINFEASVDYVKDQDQPLEKIYVVIDALAVLMEEAFQKEAMDEDFDFPLSWRPMTFEDNKLFVRFSTVNSTLEAEADRILGIATEALVKAAGDQAAEEDAMAQAIVDTDLAKEIQRRIRSGAGFESPDHDQDAH